MLLLVRLCEMKGAKKKTKKSAKKSSKNINQFNKAQKTNKKIARQNTKKGRTKKPKIRHQKNQNPKLGVHTYSSEAKPQAERSLGIWTPENRSVDEAKYTTHPPNHKRYTFYARVSPIFRFETKKFFFMDFFCKMEGAFNFLAHF